MQGALPCMRTAPCRRILMSSPTGAGPWPWPFAPLAWLTLLLFHSAVVWRAGSRPHALGARVPCQAVVLVLVQHFLAATVGRRTLCLPLLLVLCIASPPALVPAPHADAAARAVKLQHAPQGRERAGQDVSLPVQSFALKGQCNMQQRSHHLGLRRASCAAVHDPDRRTRASAGGRGADATSAVNTCTLDLSPAKGGGGVAALLPGTPPNTVPISQTVSQAASDSLLRSCVSWQLPRAPTAVEGKASCLPLTSDLQECNGHRMRCKHS